MQATNFLKGITEKLAERWVMTMFTPAFVFWAGGGLVALQIWGWENPARAAFNSLSDALKISTLILLLICVGVSGFMVQKFDPAVIRWLEGYWPKGLHGFRRRRVARYHKLYQVREDRWQTLQTELFQQGSLSPDKAEEHARLEWQQTKIPTQESKRMPTKLGNILRAAELAPYKRYGLDAFLCWPRLWMVLPELARGDISAARDELNTAARMWLWGVLFCFWALSAFWVKPFYAGLWPLAVGWLFANCSYQWAVQAAESYAVLLQSAYDLYRSNLYDAIGIKKPEDFESEKRQAKLLTKYLLRSH